MTKKIVLLQGHPDSSQAHLCHLLGDAYADGAHGAGHTVTTIDVATLDFPMLRSKEEWEQGTTPEELKDAQAAILEADHLVAIYPLWLGTMPARLKGFFEQVLRPGLLPEGASMTQWRKLKKGCSVRILVTMGMPALVYRLFYRAHSLKSLERNIFAFTGFGPIRSSLFGMVEAASPKKIQSWKKLVASLGARVR